MTYPKTLACVLLAMSPVILMQVHGKPDTPPTVKKPDPPKATTIPNIARKTNWGTIYQLGPVIRIEGSPSWMAPSGEIKNGMVYVDWTNIESGRPAKGWYEIKGANLVGRWGWESEVGFDDEGKLFGNWNSETLWAVID